MSLNWLHVSDFHIRSGDPYDRDVVLQALVHSVGEYVKRGRALDLIFATGYPQQHVWDELRGNEFPNRVFESMELVIQQLEAGLPLMAADTQVLKSFTAWSWIISLHLNNN